MVPFITALIEFQVHRFKLMVHFVSTSDQILHQPLKPKVWAWPDLLPTANMHPCYVKEGGAHLHQWSVVQSSEVLYLNI